MNRALVIVCTLAPMTAVAQTRDPKINQQIEAARYLIEQAKECDTNAADKLASVIGESVETLARAAFEKCIDKWTDSTSKLINTEGNTLQLFSPAEIAKNPYIVAHAAEFSDRFAKQNSVDAWKAKEVDRLRLFLIEKRLH